MTWSVSQVLIDLFSLLLFLNPIPCSHQLLVHNQPAMKTLGLNSVLIINLVILSAQPKRERKKKKQKNAQGLSCHQRCFFPFCALCENVTVEESRRKPRFQWV